MKKNLYTKDEALAMIDEAFLDGVSHGDDTDEELKEYFDPEFYLLTKQELKDPAWAEYEKVRDPAYVEYEKVREPALAKYKKVKDLAYAEYEKKIENIKL